MCIIWLYSTPGRGGTRRPSGCINGRWRFARRHWDPRIQTLQELCGVWLISIVNRGRVLRPDRYLNGHYNISKKLSDQTTHTRRKFADSSARLKGFQILTNLVMSHSVGGCFPLTI